MLWADSHPWGYYEQLDQDEKAPLDMTEIRRTARELRARRQSLPTG